MKIAILGYGRMGKEIEAQARKRNHLISNIFDIDNPFNEKSDINNTDVLIDFTSKDIVINNLKIAAYFGIPVVEGTTGWFDQMDVMKKISGLSVIYSPNFSLGVYLFEKIIIEASRLIGKHKEYDCYLHEYHHTGKKDSPSGTAKKLSQILLKNLPQKKHCLFETSHNLIDSDTLHVTSTRVGRFPGTHEVGFDSNNDMILLRHQAHGRIGLAYGALRAAEWIVKKRQKGIFTMDDFMNDF